MNREQLKHIFEESSCLTTRQMKGYVAGKMVHEEAHAVEVHLLSCPMCSDAIEGMFEQKNAGAVAGLEKLDPGFLAAHLGISQPELQAEPKNTVTAKTRPYKPKTEGGAGTNIRKMWKPIAVAATLVIALGIMWFMRDSIFPAGKNEQLAEEIQPVQQQPEHAATAITYDSAMTRPATDTITTGALAAETATTEEATQEETADTSAAQKAAQARKQDSLKAAQKALAKLEADKKAAAKKKEKEEPVVATLDKADEKYPARLGNSFNGPPAATTTAESAKKQTPEDEEEVSTPKIPPGRARSGIEKADEAYNEGKYKKALRLYQKEMYDRKSNMQDGATLMAAKCHLMMGENMQARTLLNSLVKENSVKKEQAQQLLKEIGPE